MAGIRGFRVAGAALLGLLLAACGGGGGGDANNTSGTTAPAAQIPTVLASKPVARTQGPESTLVGDRVTLDGAGSYSENGLITYSWSLSVPAKSAAILDSETSPKPQFIPDVPGIYTATLEIKNNLGETAKSETSIEAALTDARPVARLLNIRYVNGNKSSLIIKLDGGRSSDPNGAPLTYIWSISKFSEAYQRYESKDFLSGGNTSTPSFVGGFGKYKTSLFVFNGKTYSKAVLGELFVTAENSPPLANPGADKYVIPGSSVKVDGSNSSDPDSDGLTYSWSLVSKPAASAVSFVSTQKDPEFKTDAPGVYVLGLKVSDGVFESALSTVTIIASTNSNVPPSANAGKSQSIQAGTLANLDGGASVDPNGQTLTYAWNIKSRPVGSVAFLIAPRTKNPSFTPDKAGEYVISLVVNDGIASSEESVAVITATPSTQTLLPAPTSGSYCCRVCTTGKACGDTCISRTYSCSVGIGCAC